MHRKSWRPLLWRWHKRIGLTLILLLLWLSVTGLFLNHTDDLQLHDRPLASAWLLRAYGIHKVPASHLQVRTDLWLSQSGDYLYLNGERVAYCAPGNFSALPLDAEALVVLCDDELLLISETGVVLETLGASYGLPQPMMALGRCDQRLCLRTDRETFELDLDSLHWQPLADGDFSAIERAEAPGPVLELMQSRWVSREVNWERLMLDLHAGRVFGLGPWLMDAVALLAIILSLSGLGIWLLGRRRR